MSYRGRKTGAGRWSAPVSGIGTDVPESPTPMTAQLTPNYAPPATGMAKLYQDYPMLGTFAVVGAIAGAAGGSTKSTLGGAVVGAVLVAGGYGALAYTFRGWR